MKTSIIQVAAAAAVVAITTAVHAVPVHAAAGEPSSATTLQPRGLTQLGSDTLSSIMSFFKSGVKPKANPESQQLDKIPLLGGYPTRSAPLNIEPRLQRSFMTSSYKNHGDSYVATTEPEDVSELSHDASYKKWLDTSKPYWRDEWDARRQELLDLQRKKVDLQRNLDYLARQQDIMLRRGAIGVNDASPGVKLSPEQAKKRANALLSLGQEGYTLYYFERGDKTPVNPVTEQHLTSLLEKGGGLLLWLAPR